MTHTDHYRFPQWEPSDPVRREDINELIRRIDRILHLIERGTVPVAPCWQDIEGGDAE